MKSYLTKEKLAEKNSLLANPVFKKFLNAMSEHEISIIAAGHGIRLGSTDLTEEETNNAKLSGTYFPAMDLHLTRDEMKQFPKILQIRACEDEVRISLDNSLFEGFAYRGVNGPSGERVEEGRNYTNFKAKTTYKIVSDYIKNEKITSIGLASNTGLLTATTSPYVVFSGDGCGRFISKDGHLIVFNDYESLPRLRSEEIKRLDELIFWNVPNDKVKHIFVPQKDVDKLKKKFTEYNGFSKSLEEILIPHTWNSYDSIIKEGLPDLIALTTKENNLTAPRYRSADEFNEAVEKALQIRIENKDNNDWIYTPVA